MFAAGTGLALGAAEPPSLPWTLHFTNGTTRAVKVLYYWQSPPEAVFQDAYLSLQTTRPRGETLSASQIQPSDLESLKSLLEFDGKETWRARVAATPKPSMDLSVSGPPEQTHTVTRPQSTSWSVKGTLDDTLFPSWIIATRTMDWRNLKKAPSPSTVGSPFGSVAIEILNPRTDTRIEGRVSSSTVIPETAFSFILPVAGQLYHVHPSVRYDYEKLRTIHQPLPEDVTVSLSINGSPPEERTTPFTLRSINDCPFAYTETPTSPPASLRWMFGAYVNPDNPFVEKVLQHALAQKAVPAFKGYQGRPEEVYLEIWAIWNSFLQMGFKYTNIATPSAYSSKVASQHVRLLSESLNNTQANCVDGSVLFASVFEKIGLQSFLVLTPDHCFIGVYVDQAQKVEPLFIETTLMGRFDPTPPTSEERLHAWFQQVQIRPGTRLTVEGMKSLHSFVAACSSGRARFNEHREDFKKNQNGYSTVDIPACRKLNVGQVY